MPSSPSLTTARVLGERYLLYTELAAGGMATVHLGLLLGPVGFSRVVAIKRLHPYQANDPEFVRSFVDEAKLAGRIRHPNVVATLDVVIAQEEAFLVMDYVPGESLAALTKIAQARGELIPPAIAASIIAAALHGLQAAHDTRDEAGEPLNIVHRDVSPQNVIVGIDGVARVLDFGIAKATGRIGNTREGQVKGKLGYMAPEQFEGSVSVASDIYGMGVCLWETLTCSRLFHADSESVLFAKVLAGIVPSPSKRAPDVPSALDALTLRALAKDPTKRFTTASEMACAIEAEVRVASAPQVSAWVKGLASEGLQSRARRVAKMEKEFARCIALAPVPLASESRSSATVAAARPADSEGDASSLDPQSPARGSARGRKLAWLATGVAAAATLILLTRAVAPRTPGLGAENRDLSSAPAAQEIALVPGPPAEITTQVVSSSVTPVTPPSPPAERAGHAVLATHPRAPKRPPPLVKPSAVAPAVAPSPACAEPYTVDADGLKHYKKECLK